jgi:hypothetical protein
MSLDAEFLAMMPATLSVYPFVAFDNYGEPSYSTAVTTYQCRIESKPSARRGELEVDIVNVVTLYVASTSELNILSNYVLPDGSTGIVQTVAPVWDEVGIHHNVVTFGGG